ncbi:TetR/AcrR family transcriptional regulator [Mycobacterium sp. pR1184]|uniref:TetR/AcrR family transcriptional regulator n=1 Tax=Mycobacterium sp. pR1184 TaxID=3238981 RepID=UPI00351BE98E
MPPPERASAARTRRRDKLEPDPAVRREILAAASTTLREQGVPGLSIAAVLDRAKLSTRAFYRHFDSKDELVAAVFLETARAERRRLQRRMSVATNEIEAVAAWIDGRLDLAFDDTVKSDLRRLSLEAQSQTSISPSLIQPAYAEMLQPLGDALRRGLQTGVFHHIDPVNGAEFIQGVVWASINRQWRTGDCDRTEVRNDALRFCLRALGVPLGAINQICSPD